MTLIGLTLGALLAATQPAQPSADLDSDLGRDARRAIAQDAPTKTQAQTQAQTPAKKKPRVIRLEELKIEGRIQKPQAFYLLQRSNLNFDDLARDERFLDKVVESVEKAPF